MAESHAVRLLSDQVRYMTAERDRAVEALVASRAEIDELHHDCAALMRVRDRYKAALVYLVARCDREFTDQDQPPEMDFVMLACGEVRHLIDGPAENQKEVGDGR